MASRKLTEEEDEEDEEEEDIVVNPHLVPEMMKRLLDEKSEESEICEACAFFDIFYKQNAKNLDESEYDPELFLKLTTEILPKIFAFWQKHKDSKTDSLEKEFSVVALSAISSLMKIPVPDHGCLLFINTVFIVILQQE